VNSRPRSGQYRAFRAAEFNSLINALLARGHSVVTTAPSVWGVPCTQCMNLSITAVGGLSRYCRHIVGVPNGPMWPTFNIWNQDRVQTRVLFLDNGQKVFLSPNTEHVRSMAEATDVLRKGGLL
jgi:hypothetical protein